MTDLISRLEEAEGGSRELDDSVIIAAFNGEMMDWWDAQAQQHVIKAGDGSRVNVTPVTTSLDAALSLAERVLPGCEWEVIKLDDGCVARLGDPALCMEGEAASPALALCAAILKARSTLQGEGR